MKGNARKDFLVRQAILRHLRDPVYEPCKAIVGARIWSQIFNGVTRASEAERNMLHGMIRRKMRDVSGA